jgi:hypothetical protein
MSEDDVLFGYRLRLFALAGEIGIGPACRAMGVHHSTYYRRPDDRLLTFAGRAGGRPAGSPSGWRLRFGGRRPPSSCTRSASRTEEDGDPPEVAFYCPACATEQFDDG